jgi:hypothetical protein
MNLVLVLALIVPVISAHGFMSHPTPRMYSDIGVAIDNLRNPDPLKTFCRGKPTESPKTTIVLNPGEDFHVTLSMSDNAGHIGYCGLELYDSNGVLISILADKVYNCGVVDYSLGCVEPPGLVTGDMCNKDMVVNIPITFRTDAKIGFLRWTWVAQHVTPNEYYEVCADVNISYNKCIPVS